MSNKTTKTGLNQGTGNMTLLENPKLCTLETCELTLGSFEYIPTLPGNAAVAAIFGFCILAQLGLGVKYKTWGFMGAMILGLALEVCAYVFRIMIHDNPFDDDAFLYYLVTCTVAPAFFTAAVSIPNTAFSYLALKL